jgi:SpoVK/Ycf46/Vps4 family AAA+-type ATPase
MKQVIAKKNKPILAAQTEAQCEAAIAQYTQAKKWKEWGLDTLRDQGSVILLYGPPGTGKTMTAIYLSQRVGRGMLRFSLKDFGSENPGENERKISKLFDDARLSRNKTIFMDECEAIIWDRSKADASSMFMIPIIDELLAQISNYKGLIVMATNREEMLDSALERRILAKVHLGLPERSERVRIWEQKMPTNFPLKLTRVQIEQLSEYVLSGSDIETAIVSYASQCIVNDSNPTFQGLCNVANSYVKAIR